MKNIYSKLLLAAFIIFSVKMSAQCGTGCTTTISAADPFNYVITSGQKFCITGTGSMSGLITISSGGILCNQGTVNSPNLWVAGGIFNNYGSMNTNLCMASQGATFYNYGTITIDSFLVSESATTFVNNGTLDVNRFTTAQSATTTNNGTITSNYLYDSAAVFNNNLNLTVNYDFGNSYSGVFNCNNVNSFMTINRDFYNAYSAVFNVGYCLINVGRDWYNSAQISGLTNGSCGGFAIAGLSLNSGIVGNTAMHIDLCDAGNPPSGVDGNSGIISSSTTFCSCTNVCSIVGVAEYEQSSALIKNIYPNPATDNLTILFENMKEENIIIELRNILGQIVYVEDYDATIGSNTVQLKIDNLSQGTYIINVIDSNKIQIKKMFTVIK